MAASSLVWQAHELLTFAPAEGTNTYWLQGALFQTEELFLPAWRINLEVVYTMLFPNHQTGGGNE